MIKLKVYRSVLLLIAGLAVFGLTATSGEYLRKDFIVYMTHDTSGDTTLASQVDTFMVANLVDRGGNLYPEVIKISVGEPTDTATGSTGMDSAAIEVLTEFAGVFQKVAELSKTAVPCTLYVPVSGPVADSLYKSTLYIAVSVSDSTVKETPTEVVRYPINVWTLLGTK